MVLTGSASWLICGSESEKCSVSCLVSVMIPTDSVFRVQLLYTREIQRFQRNTLSSSSEFSLNLQCSFQGCEAAGISWLVWRWLAKRWIMGLLATAERPHDNPCTSFYRRALKKKTMCAKPNIWRICYLVTSEFSFAVQGVIISLQWLLRCEITA